MTRQGHKVADSQLPDSTICLLAPLDVPIFVQRALERIGPDVYICMETELWPVMLHETKKFGVKMLLLNGRMSQKSFTRYAKFQSFMEELLSGFSAMGVISEKDRQRYKDLGFDDSYIQVTGNIKYDQQVEDKFSTREKYRSLLGIENEIAFICGSTRTGEEELLSKVFLRLREESKQPVVWIVAPRHLERLKELKMLFKKLGLGVDLYSEIKSKKRSHPVILIDCIGELAQLYAAGDYNFCGGSLVDKGGHNIMEAIRFGKPVYFGPSMKDFHDAVKILKPIGAGFQVSDVDALTNLFLEHMHNKNLYEDACRAAAEITAIHHGAAKRQADMVTQLLAA
jgi:3-deoxy-D-manno-octulosonic-acid transferase